MVSNFGLILKKLVYRLPKNKSIISSQDVIRNIVWDICYFAKDTGLPVDDVFNVIMEEGEIIFEDKLYDFKVIFTEFNDYSIKIKYDCHSCEFFTEDKFTDEQKCDKHSQLIAPDACIDFSNKYFHADTSIKSIEEILVEVKKEN